MTAEKKDSDENKQLITRIKVYKDCYAAKSDTILTLLRFTSPSDAWTQDSVVGYNTWLSLK